MQNITALKKSSFTRILLVVIAFLIMVLSSSIVMYYTLNEKLLQSAETTMDDTQTILSRIINEPETVLELIGINIEGMYNRGAGFDAIQGYINETSSPAFKERLTIEYNSVYAYFEASGNYITGSGWTPAEDFVPTERPWYKAAPESGGIGLSEPYTDMNTSRLIISYARRMFDESSNYIGVVVIDVFVDDFRDLVINKKITPNSYGYMIDETYKVIMHHNVAREGEFFWESNSATAPFKDLIIEGADISFRRATNYEGTRVFVFGRQIYKDWYFCLIIPEKEYYAELYSMIATTGILGAILAAVLIIILVNLEKAWRTAEDERINKTIQLNEAEIANRSKSSFLAQMSHEIRTPMNSIMGVTEILLENELPDETAEGLGIIYNSCDLLLGIINDILDFSKIEAGRMDLEPDIYHIASVINDSANLNMMRIGSKEINFIINIDENIPAKMIGDALRIKQILNNVLSNAFKYTNKGTVTLSVSYEMQDGFVILIFKVQDTGCGMTKAQVDTIFDEYTRFNHGESRYVEGTGLGLAITLRLVNLMEGKIHVDSEPGAGSTFEIRIPQQTEGNEILGYDAAENLRNFKFKQIESSRKTRILREAMPYGHILIVDDVDTNLYVATGLMRPYELQIDMAMSGYEAIDKVKNGNVYDVIFMDHMMPEMDGIEAVRQIRAAGYAEPIVALTANAVTGQSDIFLENGFDAFIAKPIDLRQLNTVLNKYIRDKQPQEVLDSVRKQPEDTGKNTQQDKLPSLIPAGTEIDGLDIQGGIEKFYGDVNSYLKILRSYAVSTRKILDEIRIFDKNNVKPYEIAVHSIKGTSFDILANKTGERAKCLEDAVKNGDYEYIDENNDAFVKDTVKLIDDIDALLNSIDDDNPREKKQKPEETLLKQLLDACKEYDMDGVDAVMAQIDCYEYECDDGLVTWLSENVNLANFSQIAEKLAELLKDGD